MTDMFAAEDQSDQHWLSSYIFLRSMKSVLARYLLNTIHQQTQHFVHMYLSVLVFYVSKWKG